jgi:hypothetical protein
LTVSDVARADLLRAVIYPDSHDVASPLGNGADGIYDRVEHTHNRQGEPKETKDQNGTVHAFDRDKVGCNGYGGRISGSGVSSPQDRVATLGTNIDGAVRRIRCTGSIALTRGERTRAKQCPHRTNLCPCACATSLTG